MRLGIDNDWLRNSYYIIINHLSINLTKTNYTNINYKKIYYQEINITIGKHYHEIYTIMR